ncbi:hypothetical protein V8B97DRAFT_1573573 [Scleroderma yunnanense]
MPTSMRHSLQPLLQRRPHQRPLRRCRQVLHLQHQLRRLPRRQDHTRTQRSSAVSLVVSLASWPSLAAFFRRRRAGADLRAVDPYAPHDSPRPTSQRALSSDTGYLTTQSSTSQLLTPLMSNHVEQVSSARVIIPIPPNRGSFFSEQDHRSAPSTFSPPNDISQLLTDEQTDTGLPNNISAAAVARMMESIRHVDIREWQRKFRLSRTDSFSTTVHPSYDLIDQS